MSERKPVVQALADAFNRRALDDLLLRTAPDVVIDATTNMGDWAGEYDGHDGVRKLALLMWDSWSEIQVEVGEMLEGPELSLTAATMRFRGRSGIEVTARTHYLWAFRDGLISGVTVINDHDDALTAAGLRRPETEGPLEGDDPGGGLGEPGAELR
jgi:ketosteroid isomerase-like protein